MLKQSFSLALVLACCSCSALTNPSQFAVRCSGRQAIKINENAPSVSSQDARTYVVDAARKAVYRADPYVVSNLCAPGGRCDLEITPGRATALMSRNFGAGSRRTHTETKFILDRTKGDLRITDVMTAYVDDEPGNPITTDGTFTCVSVPVPDFKVPEA